MGFIFTNRWYLKRICITFHQSTMESKSNVLIIDDHLLFREGFEALLKGVDIINNIFQAGTEEETNHILTNYNIQLVFMDIKLEGISGIDLTNKIRKAYKHIKIIGVSMYADRSNLAKMINAGAKGYLPKNTSFKEVNEAIQAVMNGERYFSASILANISTTPVSAKGQNSKYGIYTALSPRELEILSLICLGFTSAEISMKLIISLKTVESHRYNILSKLNAKNMADVILYAVENGILNSIIH